jgi:hypothetical protein
MLPIVTDEVLAGFVLPLNVMVAVSDVGELAVKVTPSTVSEEPLPMLDDSSVPTTPVRVASTPAEVMVSLQSFFMRLFSDFAIGRWARLRLLCCIW